MKITRIRLCGVLCVLTLSMVVRLGSADSPRRPNIIFFLSDDQRHDQLGCAGHPILKTPNVDDLAANGVRFSHAFVTTPICAASRASIFTSLHERTHGYSFRTPPLETRWTQQSYPQLLRSAGYRTGFVGKFGVNVPGGVTDKMFDYFKPINRSPYFKTMPDGSNRHTTQLSGDRAIEFLKLNQNSDQPFCLSISFNAPHAEDRDKQAQFPAPKVVADWYEDVKIAGPKLASPEIYAAQPDLLKRSLNRVRYFWRWDTPEKYQKNIRGYLRMISGIDHVVGRVRGELKRLGMAENTVIIYSGDNGYYLAQRGFAGKWSHYEESLRVPLIIYDPTRTAAAGTVSDSVALNIDIPATIVSLAGLPVPDSYQGASFSPFSDGKKPAKWRDFFFCEHLMDYPVRIPKWEGVRTGQYKYARYIEQDPPYEFLHDLKSDPSELRNLAGSAEHARELAMVRKLCDRERDRLGGPYLKDPPPETNRATQPAKKKQGGKKQDQQATKKVGTPNVLLIISDDQTWTDYGFMGHPVIQTPRLDQLARESVTFTRGYVPTALCRPSLMTMITGLYPSQHGVTGNDPAIPVNLKAGTARRDAAYLAECERLRSRVKTMPTIPRLLAQRGYLSFQTGKWWEGPHSYGGFTHGMTHGDFTRGGRHGDAGLAIGRTGLQPVYDFIDLATTQKKPFFIWYAPFLPHTPHNPPPRILKKYERAGRSPALAKYYAMCEWFDETCGSLLDHLDDRKLSENTLVIYVTDNGWIQRTSTTKVPDGWRPSFAPKSKQSPYDGGVRTPIMVRWKGKLRGRLHSSLVSSIDLMPTILDACGVKPPPKLPGVSLLPVCRGKKGSAHNALFGESFAHDIADLDRPAASLLYRWAIEGDWKLIQKFPGKIGRYPPVHAGISSESELYDLSADPLEEEDRVSEHTEIRNRLQKLTTQEFSHTPAEPERTGGPP